MRIRLALLDEDPVYLSRVQEHIAAAHGGTIEIIAFTDEASALESVARTRTHVLLAHETFDIDPAQVPASCEFAYLVDSPDVEAFRGVRAVPKYTAVDDLYRAVSNMYSAASSSVQMRSRKSDGSGSLIVFTSPAGGVGTTSAALTLARAAALQSTEARTFYLTLDPFDDVSARFGSPPADHGTFSDVVYAVKRRRGNLQLQLESLTYEDEFGVCFFATAHMPTDVLELSPDDVALLLEQLVGSGLRVVLDLPFALDGATMRLLESSRRIVVLSDGRPRTNAKIVRAISALEIASAQHDVSVLAHTGLLYNRFSSTHSERMDSPPVAEIAGINRFESATESEVVDAIFASGRLDALLRSAVI